jgi:hypothetical protein
MQAQQPGHHRQHVNASMLTAGQYLGLTCNAACTSAGLNSPALLESCLLNLLRVALLSITSQQLWLPAHSHAAPMLLQDVAGVAAALAAGPCISDGKHHLPH